MKRLFVDTANQYLYLAFLDDEKILFSHYQIGNNNHSETLVNVINEQFSKNQVTVDDIEEVYVGRGPGSYTGVRVACTFAKVLAYAKKIPLYSFSSLDLMLTVNLKPGTTITKMDARHGFSYAKCFNVDNGIHVLMDDTYIETEKLLDQYPNSLIINTDNPNYNPQLILKYQLFRAEDTFNFEPTYLRSGI